MERFTGSARDFVISCAADTKALALAAKEIKRLFKKAAAFHINCIDQKLENFLVKWHRDWSGACNLKEGDIVFTDFGVGWCCDNLRHVGATPINDCHSKQAHQLHDDGDPTDAARQLTRNLLMIIQTAASSPKSPVFMKQFCPEVTERACYILIFSKYVQQLQHFTVPVLAVAVLVQSNCLRER